MFKRVTLTCSEEDFEKIEALSSVNIEDEIEISDPSADDEVSEDDDDEDVPV